jgi:CBS domain-containing protein
MSAGFETVGDVMSQQVISVGPSAGYRRIVELMATNAISGVPVVDSKGRPLGVVSEDDLLAKERAQSPLRDGAWEERGRLAADRSRARAFRARDLMTAPAATITAEVPLAVAARRMHEGRVRRLVVVAADGRMIGIVSRRDLLGVFRASDEEIRRRVVDAIHPRAEWSDVSRIAVSVVDGIVAIAGDVEYRSDVLALGAIARNVDGVVDVLNNLRCATEDVSLGSHLDDPGATADSEGVHQGD